MIGKGQKRKAGKRESGNTDDWQRAKAESGKAETQMIGKGQKRKARKRESGNTDDLPQKSTKHTKSTERG
jgi:hypothetical protein